MVNSAGTEQAGANSAKTDQTPQNVAFDQGLHCLPLLDTSTGNMIDLFNLRKSMVRS